MPASTETSYELTGDRLSAAMASLPDPAAIARLANEFFAALPVGAGGPARATTGDVSAVSPDVLTLPNVTNPAAQTPGIQYPDPQNPNIPTPGIQGPGVQADPPAFAPKTPARHHHLKFLALPATFWIELRRSTRLRHFRR